MCHQVSTELYYSGVQNAKYSLISNIFHNVNTTYTQLIGDAQIKHICQWEMYLCKSKMTPWKWRLLEEIYYYVTHLIHKACEILSTFTNQCHCLHLHSHSSTIFIIHIQCIGNTTLCNTLHNCFWWDVLPFCYDPHWLNDTSVFLGLWTYLNPQRFTIFSTDGVSGVKTFKYVCSGSLCRVVRLISWPFLMVLSLWNGPDFIFEPCS